MESLSVAVIGVGSIGRHHVRVLDALPDAEVKWVVDPALDSSEQDVEIPGGAAALKTLDELPDAGVDLAFVATPTESHHDIALRIIERDIPLLVEKPLGGSPEEAREILEAATARDVMLAVGHIERFNPIVRFLESMTLDARFMQFERLSPFTPRISSNVVSDLMVHDLDLACALNDSAPVEVDATWVSVHSDEPDIGVAVLRFESGCVATCTASRATQDKVRRVTVTADNAFIEADLLRQDVSVKRDTHVSFPTSSPSVYRQATVVEIPYLDRSGEPLLLQARDVVAAVREGRAPLVSGADGLRAVELIHRIEQSAAQSSS